MIKDLIGSVAPAIATALGGPAAGLAVDFIAKKVLGKDTATQQEVEEFIRGASHEDLMKLKQLDQEFVLRLEELGLSLEQLNQKDRASARDLASRNMEPHIILSAIYTIGYAVLSWALFTGEVVIAEGTHQFVGPVLGILTGAQVQIMNFWFGSSSGSKQKTSELLTKLSK